MYEMTASAPTLIGRFRPYAALRALVAFVKDPDDTPQVFRIVRALDGVSAERAYQRFCATATGRDILKREVSLVEVLADRAALRGLDARSLGRAYLEFVERERIDVEGLMMAAAAGGIAPHGLDHARARYRARLHAMHDLLHVLTGYGTDELGETCLLAFTYAQNRTRGLMAIIAGLSLRMLLIFPRVRVLAAVREGFRLGNAAEWLAVQDWERLLARPLDEVCYRLKVKRPLTYLLQAERAEQLDRRRKERMKE